jgi:16S rRNA processing protein RimM
LPGQDVLVIAGPTGEVLIPFVRALVPVVDIKNKKLTVIPPIIEGKVQ